MLGQISPGWQYQYAGGQQPGAAGAAQQPAGSPGLQPPAAGAPGSETQAALNTLVAPNQMAAQTWANLAPSQQQMLLGAWEAQGYNKEDAQALFNQSLPKYASGAAGAGAFRLR
jgi:hypothetical protein